jgi:hypothetical protein
MFGYVHAGRQIRLVGNFNQGSNSFKLSYCDYDTKGNTGESTDCAGVLDEKMLMDVFEDIKNGGGFDFRLLLKAGIGTGKAAFDGLISHISNYFSFFTYPPAFPLTNSFTC